LEVVLRFYFVRALPALGLHKQQRNST